MTVDTQTRISDGMTLDADLRSLSVGPTTIWLTPRQWIVLQRLAARPGAIVSWSSLGCTERVAYTLRAKIRRAGLNPAVLETVHGVGLRLCPEPSA